MSIIRHEDGSLEVPVVPERVDEKSNENEVAEVTEDAVSSEPGTMVIKPGEGGYVEALAEWESDQHPDRGEAVSTPNGRSQAMTAVHAVGRDEGDDVASAVDALGSAEEAAEALRHVLVGGTPSIEAFADEVLESEGGELIASHSMTGIIGELLAEIDSRTA